MQSQRSVSAEDLNFFITTPISQGKKMKTIAPAPLPNPKTQPVPLERGEAKWDKLRRVTGSAELGSKPGLETLTGYHSSCSEEIWAICEKGISPKPQILTGAKNQTNSE